MRPTDEEIRAQLAEVGEGSDAAEARAPAGFIRFCPLTYEEGVADALLWVLGEADDPPYPPED